MENNEQQNQTPLEPVSQVRWDEFTQAMNLLAELPTERAMQELSKGKRGPAVEKVVGTMALFKMDLVKCLRLMKMREDMQRRMVETKMTATDKVLSEFLKENPNYEIVAK